MEQYVKTWLGTVILVIMAITAGVFVWKAYQTSEKARLDFAPHIVAIKKQNPAADWKTYANTEFGYELKYPADFSEPAGPHLSNNPADSASARTPGLSFQVQFFQIAFGPINNLEEAFQISTRGNGFQEKLKKNITFNGTPAIEYAGINNSRNVHALVGTLNGQYFDLVVESKNNQREADALFSEILANFKAIK